MLINPYFQKMAEERYAEMKKNNLTEDYLNEETFGKLKVYINNKPESSLFIIEIGDDIIYVGGSLNK